mmetsp:Transcript_26039/g.57525  ORF Transcript_26039/g.57525 Transcript_26039/m.57525 type:complete len:251 (-) Transcript_26039:901-1653(-)
MLHALLHLLQQPKDLPGLSVVRLVPGALLLVQGHVGGHEPLLATEHRAEHGTLRLHRGHVIVQVQAVNHRSVVLLQRRLELVRGVLHNGRHLQQGGAVGTEVRLECRDGLLQLTDRLGSVGMSSFVLPVRLLPHLGRLGKGILVLAPRLLQLLELGLELADGGLVLFDPCCQGIDGLLGGLDGLLLVSSVGVAPANHLVVSFLVTLTLRLGLLLDIIEHVNDLLHGPRGLASLLHCRGYTACQQNASHGG